MSTQTIKAIETQYKGYRFRSRLEARWAVFFDALGLAWEYEKEGYDLGDAGWYLPDFWLPEQEVWVEVKADHAAPPQHRIFLAGKMTDWRSRLNTHGYEITGPDADLRVWNEPSRWIEDVDEETGKPIRYQTGEGFEATATPWAHDSGTNAIEYACEYLWEWNRTAIAIADTVFAWIDTDNALGTVAEAAWAVGVGKQVYLAAPSICIDNCWGHGGGNFTEWWVLEKMATQVKECTDPQEAFDHWFPPSTADHDGKSAALSSAGADVINVCGVPDEKAVLVQFREGKMANRRYTWLHFLATDYTHVSAAYAAARSARFEHGESGVNQ